MNRLMALCLAALVLSPVDAQETRYITDILQLGLHRAEDTSDTPFRNLVSGTEVSVLESRPSYARVRTADGDEGWVKSAFLVAEKPAQLRVAELESRLNELEVELGETRVESEAAKAEAAAFVASAERDLAEAGLSSGTLARLRQENADYALRMELYRGALPWPWVAGALVVAFIGGFVGGWWWLDASIRRRHGGFRLY